jgi:hypothetical protein
MDNDQEWRTFLVSEIRQVKSELKEDIKEVRKENKLILESVTTLKVKAAVLISLIGGMAGILGDTIRKGLGL